MPKDTKYYEVKTRRLEKFKVLTDKSAQQSQRKVEALDAAYEEVVKTANVLKKADKDCKDWKFLLDDKTGPVSSTLNKAASVIGKTTENKEDRERFKAELAAANLRYTEAWNAEKAAKKKLDALFPSKDEASRKITEETLQKKAADDRVDASDITRKVCKKKHKIAGFKLDAATVKLGDCLNTLDDQFARLVPDGAKKLDALGSAEKQVGEKLAKATEKEKALNDFEAQARGDSESLALAVLDDALTKLTSAEEAVSKWKGDPAGRAKLQKSRDACKETAEKARQQHLIFVEAATGKHVTLDKLEQDARTALQQNQQAEANALPDAKIALQKKGKEYEAELARLNQFRIQAGRISAAGVPTAREEHAKAKEGLQDAQQKVIAAQANRSKLENAIPIPNEMRKYLQDACKDINEFEVKISKQDAGIVALREKLANAKPDETKAVQAEITAAEEELKKLLKSLKLRQDGLEDKKETGRQQVEAALPEKEKQALAAARKEEKEAKAALKDAKELLEKQKQQIEDRVKNATASARGELDQALKDFEAAEKNFETLNAEYEKAVAGKPELKKAAEDVAAASKAAQQAHNDERTALDSYNAAEQDSVAAEVLQQALKEREQEAAAFAPFKHLKDEDFEKALRGGSAATALNLFPDKPVFPGEKASAKELKDFEKAQQEYEAKCAPIAENLRRAQETMERMLERDKILEDAEAPIEERKRAFGDLPSALLPPKFREELKAYREVDELFKIENEQKRIEDAAKEELTNSILKDLKGLAEVALPVVKLFIDASGVVNNFIPVAVDPGESATEEQKSAFDAAEALKAKFEITRMIAEGIECFLTAKEFKESEDETLDEVSDSGKDEEKAILRQIKKDDKTMALMKFMKDFMVSTASVSKGALSMTKGGISLAHNTGASGIATSIGGVVPILGAVLSGIETAEAMYDAGKQIKMAHLENVIHKAAKEGGDEEALVGAYENQAGRATNRAVKKSLHATSKAVQTAGSAAIAGGVSAHAGAGIYAAGKVVEYGNKAAFKIIDWKQAAKAQKTLELARAGSYEAMTEVFKDHQKYATMLIVMRAVKGDVKAQKFCATRELNLKMLDSTTSLTLLTKELKVARQEMLKQVEQKDEAKTFEDSAGETFEKLARGGKALVKLADMAVLGAGSKTVDLVKQQVAELRSRKSEVEALPEPEKEEFNQIKPMRAAGFTSLLARAQTLSDKNDNGFPITEKDVQWRGRWLAHMKELTGALDQDGDWKEAALKKEGGTTARQRINTAFIALQALPKAPTVQSTV